MERSACCPELSKFRQITYAVRPTFCHYGTPIHVGNHSCGILLMWQPNCLGTYPRGNLFMREPIHVVTLGGFTG